MKTDSMSIARLRKTFTTKGVSLRSYSGRGMYGAECPAVSSADLYKALGEERHEWPHDIIIALTYAKEDSLGKGSIYYWQDVDWCDSLKSSDDEER